MDITSAKTFLAIVEAGSFKGAAERLNVTQSTISMRVKSLEGAVGRALFERSRAGTVLTASGVQFQRHATALVRVWRHAKLDVALAEQHADHLAVGAQISLWEGFVLKWVGWMRRAHRDIAVTTKLGASEDLIDALIEGTLDLAIVYRAQTRPGIEVEHLSDEELVLVTSDGKSIKWPGHNYVFVNWGPEFTADHASTYPELSASSLQLDLGAIGLNFILENKASAYFPLRLVRPYLATRQLRLIERARRFVYPVYATYPEERDEEAFAPLLDGLRRIARSRRARASAV